MFLKPKQICILYTEKPQKEKKWKEKKWTKVLVQLKKKKKTYWKIWNSKLEKRYCGTGTSRRHRNYEQGGRQNIDVKA